MRATWKRVATIAAVLAGMMSISVTMAAPASALTASTSPGYFLVIGDGNAKGYDPLQVDDTYSYARKVYAKIKAAQPNVQMVNLACKGETTTTFLYGGKCSYSAGSQYQQALQFLSSHPFQVRFISLNLGGWDVYKCISMKNQTQDQMCVVGGIAAVAANYGIILGGLRLAALTSRIVVNTAYDAYTLALLLGTPEAINHCPQAVKPITMPILVWSYLGGIGLTLEVCLTEPPRHLHPLGTSSPNSWAATFCACESSVE